MQLIKELIMNTYKIDKYELTEEQYYGREAVEGNLTLNVTKLPEGFSPNFTGCVNLYNLKELNTDITAGGSVNLNSLEVLHTNITASGYVNLYSLKELNADIIVGWGVNLNSLEVLHTNITASGYVNLYSLKELNTDITAGGTVDLPNLKTNNGNIKENQSIIYSKDSKDNKYVIIDGILSEIINKKSNIFKLKNINSNKVFYCVTDGNGKYAHGDTIKNAKADLIYKLADIDKSKFEGLKLTNVLSFEKCIELYRTITGACYFGVKNFVESNNIEHRDYTVQEILDKTKNQYNNNLLVDFIK
jgi:hypothetical protein